MSERKDYSDLDDLIDNGGSESANDADSSRSGGSDGAYDAWDSGGSAFADEQVQIIDEVDVHADADGDERGIVGDVDEDEPQAGAEEKPKGKANPAILAVAALLGLGVLGGVGYAGLSMLGGSGQGSQIQMIEGPTLEQIAAEQAQAALQAQGATAAPADSVAPSGAAGSAGLDIFGDAGSPATPPTTGAAEPGAVVSEQVQAVLQADSGLSQGAAQAAPAAPQAGAQSGATAASTLAGATAVAAAAAPSQPAAAQAPATKEPAAPAVAMATKGEASTPAKATQTAKATKAASASKPKAATRTAKKPPVEEFIGDIGVRVVAVYPQSGKFAQAWLRDEKGLVQTVREGDLYKGTRVRRVEAEKLRVLLDDGRSFGPQGPGVATRNASRNRG